MFLLIYNKEGLGRLKQQRILRGQGGKAPPRCHRVSKFSAKVVEQKLNTIFLIRKSLFCLILNSI